MASSDNSRKKNLVVVLGTTGVGKTEACISIARHLHCEIINCDSRQLYESIPIGTAAPTAEQMLKVRHHFVGILPLDRYFSASMYEEAVCKLVEESRHDTFLLTGGSMMYLDAVCNGIDELPTVRDEIREEMKRRLADEGLDALDRELSQLDPQHWQNIDHNNPRRILHALEICHQTGKPYSSFLSHSKKERPFNILKIGLTRPREEMYERINLRVLKMMDDGLEEEARKVYPLRHHNSLNTVGYKELFDFFDGTTDLEEAVRRIQSNTRRYMRKQETWFKRDKTIKWFAPTEIKEIIKYIDISLELEKE
ncbi:MAG: tRNA (adenosine(37)-N6)-dimethylallyltransferase MiaA [Bacteroidales bacterium]|nr:tRNA (adenosine(37)-N6)-dimethylallyltransferase MiaA [Bacteroidales bacterium]MDY5034791.1 tRNA (adenosine(37)-N6)-dimethylallyltransferase MiaA [Prevotella sp.]